jgi:hypothetical protein
MPHFLDTEVFVLELGMHFFKRGSVTYETPPKVRHQARRTVSSRWTNKGEGLEPGETCSSSYSMLPPGKTHHWFPESPFVLTFLSHSSSP